MIRQDLTSLKWLMLAITSSESATAALITIATTYMSHSLQMSANEIGIVFLSVLIMGAPGSKLGEVVALRLDALVSAKACTIFFILSTSLASVLLTSPRDKHLTPIFGICWGLALGWLHPMHSTLFITITPAGQETELMSLYLFCGQVLSWLPPLLFTILNEMGVSMSIGLASLNVFFAIGLACLHNMGSYNVARDQALLRRDLVPSDEHTDGSDTNGGEESLPPIL
jgi:MFS-type transporter involved in bile tolerance (Atg22 family)